MSNSVGHSVDSDANQGKLGLLAITINAMALIAPGAFLWTTYQLQAPKDSAPSMWAAVALATIIALLTASCYATLSRAYPEAGAGSSYYYAEAAIIAKEEHAHFRFARIAKFFTGWAAHLYYWVYPGVMVGFMGTILVFIGQLFKPDFASDNITKVIICFVFAAVIGSIALVGVTGSTLVNIIINIIQIASLAFFSILAIAYRLGHPSVPYEHASGISVFLPHDFKGLIFQTTIAILLVVGFESATALAGEAKNPGKDIPRGVILSLVIQACICYFLEYFAANFFISENYQGLVDKSGGNFLLLDAAKTLPANFNIAQVPGFDPKVYAGGSIVHGFDAAAASSAPIGDMAKILGDSLLGGQGFIFELVLGITVVLALIGTGLSCLATGVRVTYAMGGDRELPEIFSFMHGRFKTPHIAIYVLTITSAIIGGFGAINSDNLTIIGLISNIGTFLLYGFTCAVTFVASMDHLLEGQTNPVQTKVIPALGAILNFAMMVGVIYFGVLGTGNSQKNVLWAIAWSVGFFVVGLIYLFINSSAKGEPLFLPPDHVDSRRGGV